MSLAASDAEEWVCSGKDPGTFPSKQPTQPSVDSEQILILSNTVEDFGLDWLAPEEPAHSCLGEWYRQGWRQWSFPQRPAPFYPEVHDNLTRTLRAPYSAHVHSFTFADLTTVYGTEKKGYGKAPPLEEVVAAHLCPPSPVGLKVHAVHPSKPCRTTFTLADRAYSAAGQAGSELHTMVVLQVFQVKLLCPMDESVHSSDAFNKLHTENEQLAIGKAMANLVVLEHHLWLNLTEIKDTDKMPHSPLPCLALGDGRSVEAGSVLLTQHMPK